MLHQTLGSNSSFMALACHGKRRITRPARLAGRSCGRGDGASLTRAEQATGPTLGHYEPSAERQQGWRCQSPVRGGEVPILSAGSCRREWNRAEAGALGCPAPPNPAWPPRPPALRPKPRLPRRICPALEEAGASERAPRGPATGSAASGSRQEAIGAGGTGLGCLSPWLPLRHLLPRAWPTRPSLPHSPHAEEGRKARLEARGRLQRPLETLRDALCERSSG